MHVALERLARFGDAKALLNPLITGFEMSSYPTESCMTSRFGSSPAYSQVLCPET
jgi:hypothetical protein